MNAITEDRIDEATAACEERIGEVWAEMFPEATTGDFPPEASHALNETVQSALRLWLELNTDLLDN